MTTINVDRFAPLPEDGPAAMEAFKHFKQWAAREDETWAAHRADPTDHAKFRAYCHAEGMVAETIGLYWDELRDARAARADAAEAASTKPAA